MKIVFYIILIFILVVICPLFFINLFVGRHLYFLYLVRGKEKDSWSRTPVIGSDEEQRMYDTGYKWEEEVDHLKKEVSIYSDGFKLCGQYFNLGFDKCVIVVAGRSEACHYSYYFAIPYAKLGYNVLVIDNRCHGLSEGKYNSLGFKEYKDILNWVKYLHDIEEMKEIIGHGICIGSATILYALTNDECPTYFKGMVADGMYVNFPVSFNNHAVEAGHSPHFVSEFFMMYFKHYTKENPYIGPIDYIEKLEKPILFLYSKEDNYSTPDKGQLLFDLCKSKKELVWFDKGSHSHIRINNEILYDQAITNFINENFKGENDEEIK